MPISRAIVFFCLWVVISGASTPDLAVGIPVAIGAAWVSINLLPSSNRRLRPLPLIRLALRFPFESITAGVDVARRAFDPALPLCPGIIPYASSFPPGVARSAFTALASMKPGSIPVPSNDQGGFEVHCIDLNLPVTSALEEEEARLKEALSPETTRG